MNLPPPGPAQTRTLWFTLTTLAVAVLLGLLGLAVWGLNWVLNHLSSVLLPMAFALVLAYILDPLVEALVRRRVPRLWSILLVFMLGLVLAGAVVGSILPDIVHETRELITTLPADVARLRERLQNFLEHSPLAQQIPALLHAGHPGSSPATNAPVVPPPLPAISNHFDISFTLNDTNKPAHGVVYQSDGETVAGDLDKFNSLLNTPLSDTILMRLEELLKVLLRWVGNQLAKVTVWAEFLVGLVLVPVYLFYFLLEKDGILRAWTDYLPMKESRTKEEVVFVLQSINDCLIAFFRGQVLVSLCVGVLLTSGYLVLGLNYAILIGLVAATLGIVPYLGAIVALIFALGIAALQFGDWHHPLYVLLIAGAVKLIEDFIISPKIMGERSGLHPLTIIVAVMVGTTVLGGLLGAILAIPLTAVLRTLMFRYIWKRAPAAALQEKT